MTLLVGILCSDGVVLASDSAATYAQDAVPTIGQQVVTKIRKLSSDFLYGSTGSIGMSQLISGRLGDAWVGKKLGVESPASAMQNISNLIIDSVQGIFRVAPSVAALVGQQAAGSPVLCKSIVALPIKRRPSLFTFEYSGAPEQMTEELPFVALGSGQNIADPFLAFLKRILWDGRRPTLAEGRFAAAWTIYHTEKVVPGFVGGPIQMASLTMSKDQGKIDIVDPAEHENSIASIEAKIREHILQLGLPENLSTPLPEVPKPS